MRPVPMSGSEGWLPLCEELQQSLGRLDPPGELLRVAIDPDGLPRFEVKLDPRSRTLGREILHEFENRALGVCEACGGPGRVRAGAVLTIRCDHCV
jgi:hypothetical protein